MNKSEDRGKVKGQRGSEVGSIDVVQAQNSGVVYTVSRQFSHHVTDDSF